jgi:uncharacterized protein YbgA (DUF1722 family)
MGGSFPTVRRMELLSQDKGPPPLIVPLTLLKHHLNRHPVPDWVPVPSAAWVHQQAYLHP